MNQLRSLAYVSVGRLVLFGWMPIAVLVLGFSFEPTFALKIGGIGTLILCLILVELSEHAHRIDPRGTDLWSMLSPARRPRPGDGTFRDLSAILRETYLRFARWVAGAAAAFFGGAVVSSAVGG